MNPETVLHRGYALVTNNNNELINSGTEVHKGDNIHISMKKEIIDAEIIGVSKK